MGISHGGGSKEKKVMWQPNLRIQIGHFKYLYVFKEYNLSNQTI
jgi:hypothetical protein